MSDLPSSVIPSSGSHAHLYCDPFDLVAGDRPLSTSLCSQLLSSFSFLSGLNFRD